MFKNYTTNNTVDFIMDHYRTYTSDTYPNELGFYKYSNYPYDFTNILDWMRETLPTKVTKSEYPDYPKCYHAITKEGTNVFKLAVTGFDKSDIEIEVKDDFLVISGKQKDKEEKTDDVILHNSISQKSFEFAIKLSEKFDTDKIESDLKNGLLTVKIPLSEVILKKNKKIEIK